MRFVVVCYKLTCAKQSDFPGGSSGSAMVAALKVAKTLDASKRVVVILPDNVRNYLTKFLSDKWMEERHFID